MATKPKTDETVAETVAVEETENDLVELYVPKGNVNDEPNLFIGVNGKNWLLPKGKKSMVPRFIKAEYDRSVAAQEAADERIDEMIEATKQPVAYV